MNRYLFLLAFGILGLGLAAAGDDRPGPSSRAIAAGYPPGAYAEAVFEISDDPAVMVIKVDHEGQTMRVYGDGRSIIEVAELSYTRRMSRSRLQSIVRSAVDNGLAEFDAQFLIVEIGRADAFKPCVTPRVEAEIRFTSYARNGSGAARGSAGICPADYPQIAQSRGYADLAAVLGAEVEAAKREGSIELPAVDYKTATFR